MNMVTVNIKLPEPLDLLLRREARKRTISKSDVIREAILEKMERQKKAPSEPRPNGD